MKRTWTILIRLAALVCLIVLPAVSYGDCPDKGPCFTVAAPGPEAIFEVSQSNLCLKLLPGGGVIEDLVKNSISGGFKPFFATVDVQFACNAAGTAEVFGVWTTNVGADESNRRNGLSIRPTILQNGENFAVLFTPGIVQKAADAVWAAMPKNVSVGGFDIVAQSMLPILLVPWSQVATMIHGYVDTHVLGWEPGIDVALLDTISVSDGNIPCITKTLVTVEDPGPDPKLDLGIKGVGCRFVATLPTSAFPIEKFVYDRASVSYEGIAAGANFRPFALLKGPATMVIQKGEETSETFTVSVANMKAPLQYAWTITGAGGSATAGNPTVVTFKNPKPGVTHTVKVTITDANNATATTSQNVQLQNDQPINEKEKI